MAPRYVSKQNKALPVVLLVLLLIAVGAGVFCYLKLEDAQTQTALIQTADYSDQAVEINFAQEKKTLGVGLEIRMEESVGESEYMTPLGFPIVSYSEKWQGDKLIEIYDELLNNAYGEEIHYISKIVVHPGMSEIGTADSVVAGTHSTTSENYTVFFDLPALVPASMKYSLTSKQSVIELFNMDEHDTIEEAARTIAHEYGHHYTIYYFMQDDDAVKKSPYYNLRSFNDFDKPVFFSNNREYLENHEWSIYEIAAEDYVQLLGSPNAKQIKHYKDVYDVLMERTDEEYRIEADDTTVNVFPQENIHIPLADEVDGLSRYYYSFIDNDNAADALDPYDFDMQITKHRKNKKTYYDITWVMPSTHPDALYTVVCYDTDRNIFMPVRTVYGNEKPIARVGTVSRISGNTIYTCTNEITDEDRYFRIIALLPDGRMQASKLYFVDF